MQLAIFPGSQATLASRDGCIGDRHREKLARQDIRGFDAHKIIPAPGAVQVGGQTMRVP